MSTRTVLRGMIGLSAFAGIYALVTAPLATRAVFGVCALVLSWGYAQ